MLRWQELRDQRCSVSAEELCAGCPEQLEELKRQIQALQSMEDFLGTSPGDTPSAAWPQTLSTGYKAESGSPLRTTPPDNGTSGEPLPSLDLRGYELLEQLGSGGMGDVYRAADPALGRDLAVKVMKPELRGMAPAEQRFLREARVTGSLQHPSIVPVYNLGRLNDGRLHYTMRLVRGQTFANILKEESGKREQLPYLLTIFEKICQAAAYAHSKRVIHRDLKPSNVMVGRFGEVQVMDWGLAKLLASDDDNAGAKEMTETAGTRIPTGADTPVDLSRTGSGFGTLAYMPSEQARGKWDMVDERADVFALGSILCEMLTGQPAYIGKTSNELIDRVERGDVTEALERLRECGAAAELTELCRDCLSPDRENRPRDAAVLAKRVAEYQAEVQERLRQAELQRVAAETRAREEQARALVEQERTREALARVKAERRARRQALALGAALMVLIVGGGGALWWKHVKQTQVNSEALGALERGRKRLEEGWRANDVPKLSEAVAEVERATAIARNGGASEAVEQQVAALQTETQERLDRAKENQKFLSALLDIAIPHETKTYRETGSGELVMAIAEPSVEEQFAAAFRRRWPDVEVDKQAAAKVAARLQEEPEAVLQGVIAGLDGWMLERRRQNHPEAEWRPLLGLVDRLDASEPRRQLRAFLISGPPPSATSVAGLLAGQPPWLALWEFVQGNDWRRLRHIRGQISAADETVLTGLLMAEASSAVGDATGGEELLRLALARRPDEVALLDALGRLLERQERLDEAIGCYRAARARDKGLGLTLGRALGKSGQWAEGEAVLRDLVRQQPKNPEMFFHLGKALNDQGNHVEAEAACRKAIALKPDFAEGFVSLGVALNAQGKPVEAEAAYRKASALKPGFAEAYNNLGAVLDDQGKPVEAEAACRKAIALKPDLAQAYNNLGAVLNDQGKPVEAEAACRKAIALKPDLAQAYGSLGNALKDQGKLAEAEAVFRKAIALKPDLAKAHNNLGAVLNDQGKPVEAEAACRKAIALKPDLVQAHGSLGNALAAQGKPVEAEVAFREAIALKPDYAVAYNNLGNALNDQGKPVEAEAACRKAIDLKPDYALAYNTLGAILNGQGKPVEAEVACRKAIDLKPDYALAYNNLGNALGAQGKPREAEAAYRKTIALKPDLAQVYNNLGAALGGQGKPVEAEVAFREAIALKPDLAQAHCNLGSSLERQGRFSAALAAYRRGHELGSKQAGWRYPSLQRVRNAERMVELEKKLQAILQGETSPANSSEAASFAQMCQQPYQKRYAVSARLYAEAFVLDPKLAADLNQQHRYNAACSAALAAAGQGEDAHSLPDKSVAMFRRWALGWLRDELTAYTKLTERNNPAANQAIQQRLVHWKGDSDLVSVRDAQSLDRLPDNERTTWQALWGDVDDLTKRLAKMDAPTKARRGAETPKTKP
jgi:tetratricopeptide (TPR) repeat protein